MTEATHEHIHESIRHLAVDVTTLTPDPKNARKHNRRNLDAIKASLEKFGFRQPIIVQKQGMVVRAGNGRLEVSKELGWSHIPALVVDESEADAVAYAIADNRTAELAEWDWEGLSAILTESSADWSGLSLFDDKELDLLSSTETWDPETGPSITPDPQSPGPEKDTEKGVADLVVRFRGGTAAQLQALAEEHDQSPHDFIVDLAGLS